MEELLDLFEQKLSPQVLRLLPEDVARRLVAGFQLAHSLLKGHFLLDGGQSIIYTGSDKLFKFHQML